MIKFLNLSPVKSKGLDKPLYRNALSLKKDAILIAENRQSYSAATSILILSTEEVIKSVLVFLHSENCTIYKVKDAKKFFSDHVIRHQLAMLIDFVLGIYESYHLYETRNPTKILNTKKPWFNDLVNGFIDVVRSVDPLLKTEESLNYLQTFNNVKNKGFYVDYRDGLMEPIKEVTIEDYKMTLKISNRIFKFNKLMRILFHEKIENHMEQAKITRLRSTIKEFINDGLGVFSLAELTKI